MLLTLLGFHRQRRPALIERCSRLGHCSSCDTVTPNLWQRDAVHSTTNFTVRLYIAMPQDPRHQHSSLTTEKMDWSVNNRAPVGVRKSKLGPSVEGTSAGSPVRFCDRSLVSKHTAQTDQAAVRLLALHRLTRFPAEIYGFLQSRATFHLFGKRKTSATGAELLFIANFSYKTKTPGTLLRCLPSRRTIKLPTISSPSYLSLARTGASIIRT